MLNPREGLLLYTDGSYGGKNSPGGWGWVAVDSEEHESDSGFVPPPTTNNRMELQAPIEGLKSLYRDYGPCAIEVVSDSSYVVLGATYPERARNVNNDLWDELEAAAALHEHVQWRLVKGHLGIGWNEVADQIAVKARKESSWK